MESRLKRLSYASSISSSFSYLSRSSTLFDNGDISPASKLFPSHSNISSASTEETSLSDGASSFAAPSYDSSTKLWLPRGILGKVVRGLGSSAVELVSEYTLKKRLTAISSRIDSGKDKIHAPSNSDIRELEDLYEDLLER